MSESADPKRLDPEGRVPPSRYFVTMTVSTYVEARDKAEAMQAACDLVHPLVIDGRLGVHTADAQWAPPYVTSAESPHGTGRP